MANKYCQQGLATGLNDGTSVANAWQDFQEVVLGTFVAGSIVAGDIVHICTQN